MKTQFLILSSALILAACTSMKHTPVQTQSQAQWQEQRNWREFHASGRMGVKVDDKGYSAHFDWTLQNAVETLDINTPLGNTIGQLCQDMQGVLAVDYRNRVYTAENASELSEQLLGYALPLAHLSVWANGEWVRDVPHQFTSDGQLQQMGWTIAREANDDQTPRILQLVNEKLSLRLVFGETRRQEGRVTTEDVCAARMKEQ